MKTLKNHTLLYDQECPLCQFYTSGFIKTKMLDANGRASFSEAFAKEFDFVDMKRASNEIALVNKKDSTVIYGIDSLLRVLGVRFPIIERIGHLKPMKFLLKHLYAFISYNRKVIVPSKALNSERFQCTPSFNNYYRFSYILLATIVTMSVLFSFSKTLVNVPESSLMREGMITIGQILFQALCLLGVSKKTVLNYIGHLMTVSLMGAVLLTIILLLHSVLQFPNSALMVSFGVVVCLMFIEHFRRVKILKLPIILSFTWVLYRLLILLFIFN